MPSIKLPLRETTQVASIKLPLKETVWLLNGFIVEENIIDWKEQHFLLSENIMSRIIIDGEMVDKNHIKFKWYGEEVPKVEVYRRVLGDSYGEPEATLKWDDGEYIMYFDSNAYEIKLMGTNETGESDKIVIGQPQEYDVNVYFELPVNEKYYYVEVEFTSVYKVEVNL